MKTLLKATAQSLLFLAVCVAALCGLDFLCGKTFGPAYEKPLMASLPSDAEAVVRALDRISAKLEKLDDTLRDRCGR